MNNFDERPADWHLINENKVENDVPQYTRDIEIPLGNNKVLDCKIPLPENHEQAEELRGWLLERGVVMEDVIGDYLTENAI